LNTRFQSSSTLDHAVIMIEYIRLNEPIILNPHKFCKNCHLERVKSYEILEYVEVSVTSVALGCCSQLKRRSESRTLQPAARSGRMRQPGIRPGFTIESR
jgi:hypothetical protein